MNAFSYQTNENQHREEKERVTDGCAAYIFPFAVYNKMNYDIEMVSSFAIIIIIIIVHSFIHSHSLTHWIDIDKWETINTLYLHDYKAVDHSYVTQLNRVNVNPVKKVNYLFMRSVFQYRFDALCEKLQITWPMCVCMHGH